MLNQGLEMRDAGQSLLLTALLYEAARHAYTPTSALHDDGHACMFDGLPDSWRYNSGTVGNILCRKVRSLQCAARSNKVGNSEVTGQIILRYL
jgi:hypothetical protein